MSTFGRLEPFVAGPSGAPLVTFIPGIGNDASFWRRQADELSDTFQTLRFEPWGCGASGAAPNPCTIDDVADGIVELWDSLEIDESSIVGLGFGGSCAMNLGLRHPGRVSRIVACCCRPRQPDDRRQFWRDRQAAARQNGLAELTDITVDRWLSAEFRAANPQTDESLRAAMRRNSVEGYCAYVSAFIEMEFADRLGQLTAPTLLIAAENDHGGGPPADMAAMAPQIPNASLHVIKNCGHICNHEAPDEVSSLLRRHLG